ncbi:IDEAL domain-containing protein [Priestia megaterium]|uniref:IDEAL domain-containing protein n=1 Tax=Priestia megaterium TaxID=1404 RepID=UPI0012B7C659|nr:IDEAL domain-containing protein [Priestia megaterium]
MEKNIWKEMSEIEKNICDEILGELFLSEVRKELKRGKIVEEIDEWLKNKEKEAFLGLRDEVKFVC